ncbi:MAG: ABC transporter permease subunit [Rhizobiaceae bacterium]|jgi:putative thiamine transport system permease protein|nr:ABC transporter permease subunit [Rhizobiaceae bacterium]
MAGGTSFLPRLGPPLTLAMLTLPVAAGLAGTLLPAFGYLPALGGERLSFEPFLTLAAEPGIWRSAWLSFSTGLAATLAAFVVTVLFLAAAPPARLARISALMGPLLAVPHAAAAFGLALLIAPTGFLVRLVSPELTGWTSPPDLHLVNDPHGIALIAGLAAKEIPFLVLVALAALPQVPAARSRHLAASLGYGRIAGFIQLVLPPLYRQMRLAIFAVLAFSTSVIDVAMILGPQTPPVLGVRILDWFNDPDLTMRFCAAAGALLQLGVTLAAFAAWMALERLGAALRRHLASSGTRFAHDAGMHAAIQALMIAPALTLFGGLVVLGLWSVSGTWRFPDALPAGFSLDGWAQALPRLAQPLLNTVLLGVTASLIAALLAILCLMREDETSRHGGFVQRHALTFIYLPLLLPQAAFLFGLQFLFVSVHWEGRFAAVLLAHLVFVTPYVFLSLSDPWRALDTRYMAMAAALGAGPWRAFLAVRAPMLLRAILSAVALGFAVSSAQYLATVLAGAGRLTTITTEAVALASGGNRRIIGIFAMMQMLLPALAFAIATLVPAWLWRDRRGLAA